MPQKSTSKAVLVLTALALVSPAGAQVIVPAAAPPGVKVEQSPVTLGDLARIARDAEAEKQRRALREAKGEAARLPAAEVAIVRAQKKKEEKKAPSPEGLFVRAIFGVAPKTYVRFFTKNNEFEDRQVGEFVQGWQVIGIRDGIVTLQQGDVIYPIALQMRSAASLESVPGTAVGSTLPVIRAGQLPDPRVGQ